MNKQQAERIEGLVDEIHISRLNESLSGILTDMYNEGYSPKDVEKYLLYKIAELNVQSSFDYLNFNESNS